MLKSHGFLDMYLKRRKKTLLPPFIGYFSGIAIGAFVHRFFYADLSQGLAGQIALWAQSLTDGSVELTGELFLKHFFGNVKYLIVALLLALFNKSNLITILLLTGIRGFCVGFTFALISVNFGLKGFFFNATGLWPQSLLTALVLIIFCSSTLVYCQWRDPYKSFTKIGTLHPRLLLILQFVLFSAITAGISLLSFVLPAFASRIVGI